MRHRLKPAPSESGFALLATLWLLVTLTALVGLGVGAARLGQQTTINRVILTRARWAAEACLAVAQARWAEHGFADTASLDLGRGTWCRWSAEDATAKVNVNTADRELIEALSTTPSFPHAVLERRRVRPFGAVEELARLPGWDSALAEVLTVDGPGTVNVSAARARVLAALPGLAPEAVERLHYRRIVGRPIASLDDLAGELSPSGRAVLLSCYADLARLVTFAAPQLVVTAEGWIEGRGPLRATIEVVVVPLPERLAVIRRRMW